MRNATVLQLARDERHAEFEGYVTTKAEGFLADLDLAGRVFGVADDQRTLMIRETLAEILAVAAIDTGMPCEDLLQVVSDLYEENAEDEEDTESEETLP